MARVVKVIELMSQSPETWKDAVQSAATKTLRNIRSMYIKEFTTEVDGGKITSYRINAKVTFDLQR